MASQPSGTVTFLFTDIEGSTRLWESAPDAMSGALQRHNTILRQVISSAGGYVFKEMGDAFCAAFATAPAAVTAALQIQKALAVEPWQTPGPIRVRVALHTGIADERDGDYFGPSLNRVSRLLLACHGAQTLLSAATTELVRDLLPPGVSLRDLGAHRLKDLTRPEQLFQLNTVDLPDEFPPLRTLDLIPHNLPLQPTALIGRERESAALRALLRRDDVRLVTLTGAGGTGKTRLALQVAADMIESFPDGVFFVPLAAVNDPELVTAAIAHALGVREAFGVSLGAGLREYLSSRHTLLILDNFEQVISAAPLVASLLGACPILKILVTSREVLRLRSEREIAVPPLSLPDPHQLGATALVDLTALTQYEAVRLFIERAQEVRAEFTVTNENAPAIAEICVRLDGLPLAIELAAARTRLLTPQALLARLGRRLALLTGGARDLPARQQTLRSAIDWSYNLLTPAEQAVFARLALFAGGCALDDAEAVCAHAQLSAPVVDILASLVEKSLLRKAGESAALPRFMLLETVREYAGERLLERGELQQLRARHAMRYLELAERAARELGGPHQLAWLERLELEHDNMRAALEAVAPLDQGLRLAGALVRFWKIRGHLSEGLRWLEHMITAVAGVAPTPALAGALCGAAELALQLGEREAARRYAHTALETARSTADRASAARALITLGWFAREAGDYTMARSFYDESLLISRALADRWAEAQALANLGRVARHRGQDAEALTLYGQSLALVREVGDPAATAAALADLGTAALARADYGLAGAHFDEALQLWSTLGDRGGMAYALRNLGRVAARRGEMAVARARYEEALGLARDVGDRSNAAITLVNLGSLTREQGDFVYARACYEQSLALHRAMDDRAGAVLILHMLAQVARVQSDETAARGYKEEEGALRRALGDSIGVLPDTPQPLPRLAPGPHDARQQAIRRVGWLILDGRLQLRKGDLAAARRHFAEALTILHELGDQRELAARLLSIGESALQYGDYETARHNCAESATLYRTLGDTRRLLPALMSLGHALVALDHHDEAWVAFDEGLAISRRMSNSSGLWADCCTLTELALDHDDHARARSLATEIRALKSPESRLARRVFFEARAQIAREADIYRRLGMTSELLVCLDLLGLLAWNVGRMERAARLWGAAEAARDTGAPPIAAERLTEYERRRDDVRRLLGEEAFERAWKLGRGLSVERAVDEGLMDG